MAQCRDEGAGKTGDEPCTYSDQKQKVVALDCIEVAVEDATHFKQDDQPDSTHCYCQSAFKEKPDQTA